MNLKSFLFENKDVRQTIAKNTFWLTVGQLGSRLIRAAIVIYAARILGAAEYGVFSYVVGLAGFFTVFSDIGVGQIMTREAAKNPSERSYYFATSFWIKAVLLFLVALIIIFIAPYFTNIRAAKAIMPLVALLVIFDGLRELSLSFFRALEKMEWEAFASLITNALIASFGFIALYFSQTAATLTMVYALSVGLGAIISAAAIRQEFFKIFNYCRARLVRPIIKSALPIAFQSALGAFMLNTDLVMLGWWVGAADIGFYSAGQKIIQFLYVLPAIIASAVFPTLSRLIGGEDNERIKLLMEKSLILVLLVAIPMVLGGIIIAQPVIKLLYDSEYLPAAFNFQILMLTLLVVFPGVLLGNAAIAYNQQSRITKYLALSAISNILINALLIPRIGIIGSSISTIIALTIDVGLVWRLLAKINNFYVLPRLVKIILASLVMAALSWLFLQLGLNIIANIVISAALYLSMLYIFKEKTVGEILEIVKPFRRPNRI